MKLARRNQVIPKAPLEEQPDIIVGRESSVLTDADGNEFVQMPLDDVEAIYAHAVRAARYADPDRSREAASNACHALKSVLGLQVSTESQGKGRPIRYRLSGCKKRRCKDGINHDELPIDTIVAHVRSLMAAMAASHDPDERHNIRWEIDTMACVLANAGASLNLEKMWIQESGGRPVAEFNRALMLDSEIEAQRG